MSEEVYPLRWAWYIQDQRLIERIDVSISRRFLELGYTRITGDRYLQLHGYSHVPRRDMVTAYQGKEGAFLLCAGCRRGIGGLHLHITSYGTPNDPRSVVYSHLQQVDDFAKKGTLLDSRIQEAEQALLGGWRPPTAALSLLGGVASLWAKPIWRSTPVGAVVDYLFLLILVVSVLYVLMILVLVVSRAVVHLLYTR